MVSPNPPQPQPEVSMETIKQALTEMFRNSDMLAGGLGPKADPAYYRDARIRAENKLRQVVGAPIVSS